MVSKRSDGFAARESGAAAFDWVILAVGVFGLGLAVYSVITAEIAAQRPDPPAAIEQISSSDVGPAPPTPDLPLLYPYFDEGWRRERAAHYAEQSDADLLVAYGAQYGVATGGVNARIGADLLAVIEAEMTRRGLPLPDDHDPAAVIHRRLSRETAPP